MRLSRRDFMKMVGISVSSLLLTNCNIPVPATCYAPIMPSLTPMANDPKSRLRRYWLSFGELAAKTQEASATGSTEDSFGQGLVSGHRTALDELVSAGALTSSVADLIQEAYGAAVNHVWRSNALITCYEPAMIDFTPASAEVLVQQSAALDQIAQQGNVDPQTLENARLALEHDLAFYSLSDDEVNALYKRLMDEWQAQGQGLPGFDQVELEISADDKAAAQFIIGLLTSK